MKTELSKVCWKAGIRLPPAIIADYRKVIGNKIQPGEARLDALQLEMDPGVANSLA